MKLNAALGALMATSLVVIASMQLAAASGAGQYLVPGYYKTKNCSDVERIVREEVFKALHANRSNGPALVRLFFHDCWVNGCDGSVLLDASAKNPKPEQKANASNDLRGFDVIKTIKDRLESRYHSVVSCADILAFAPRDAASYLSGGRIDYAVPSGRRDGVISRAKDADAALPSSTSSFGDLAKNFVHKNFTVEELVVLSGAHSIGVAHYPSFKDRLTAPAEREINGEYKHALINATKSRSVVANNIRDETDSFKKDAGYYQYPAAAPSSRRGNQVLDNTYYHNVLDNKVLFKSDWALRTNDFALGKLKEYRDKPSEWDSDFAAAMVKLSKLLPAKGSPLEIRKKCSAINDKPPRY